MYQSQNHGWMQLLKKTCFHALRKLSGHQNMNKKNVIWLELHLIVHLFLFCVNIEVIAQLTDSSKLEQHSIRKSISFTLKSLSQCFWTLFCSSFFFSERNTFNGTLLWKGSTQIARDVHTLLCYWCYLLIWANTAGAGTWKKQKSPHLFMCFTITLTYQEERQQTNILRVGAVC